MPHMDYPNDDYKPEKESFERPRWADGLILVGVCAFFWCIGIAFTPNGLQILKECLLSLVP